ncbi:hypothetical protein ACLKA7_005332 [Drosophila subpalustris]
MSLKRFGMKTNSRPRRNREELLQSITRDRALLHAYFQELSARGEESHPTTQKDPSAQKVQQIQQRDSYDLFFESACISIKSLPPKLAAEAKSRISQIITEFELRAISEEEAQREREKTQQQQKQQIVKTVRVSENEDTSSSGIVYEFQPYT